MMDHSPTPHRALADAIAALLGPLVEVAVHDIASDTVAYVANPLSPREVGDPSDLRELGLPGSDGFIGPYEKTNWDGRRLKSVSVLLPGQPAAMLCINLDLSRFEAMRELLGAVLRPVTRDDEEAASVLLRHDWHEQINRFIASWCSERGIDTLKMTKPDRRQLIADVLNHGGFDAPRSAAYIAKLLKVSRATIYNELAEVRKAGSAR